MLVNLFLPLSLVYTVWTFNPIIQFTVTIEFMSEWILVCTPQVIVFLFLYLLFGFVFCYLSASAIVENDYSTTQEDLPLKFFLASFL